MTIKLKIWTKAETGEVRVYVGARFAERRFLDADGGWFGRREDGKITLHYQRSGDGRYGWAMRDFAESIGVDINAEDFDSFVAAVREAKGPRGAEFNMDVFLDKREAARCA
jgi:hypothetical protein